MIQFSESLHESSSLEIITLHPPISSDLLNKMSRLLLVLFKETVIKVELVNTFIK